MVKLSEMSRPLLPWESLLPTSRSRKDDKWFFSKVHRNTWRSLTPQKRAKFLWRRSCRRKMRKVSGVALDAAVAAVLVGVDAAPPLGKAGATRTVTPPSVEASSPDAGPDEGNSAADSSKPARSSSGGGDSCKCPCEVAADAEAEAAEPPALAHRSMYLHETSMAGTQSNTSPRQKSRN